MRWYMPLLPSYEWYWGSEQKYPSTYIDISLRSNTALNQSWVSFYEVILVWSTYLEILSNYVSLGSMIYGAFVYSVLAHQLFVYRVNDIIIFF